MRPLGLHRAGFRAVGREQRVFTKGGCEEAAGLLLWARFWFDSNGDAAYTLLSKSGQKYYD
jgi:hypothetical protein